MDLDLMLNDSSQIQISENIIQQSIATILSQIYGKIPKRLCAPRAPPPPPLPPSLTFQSVSLYDPTFYCYRPILTQVNRIPGIE